MELMHLELSQLCISSANMRMAKKPPDITDILPSVRARGILTPLLVRPNGEADHYEIVAGRRRYHAALAVAGETGEFDPLPCAVMQPGDDAAALEASIIENVARLDPDEVTQWVSFTRLVKEGRDIAEVAATFGISERRVKRVLALGNLHPRIRDLYRTQEIDAATIRHLTLASREKQREWLALYRDPDAYAPTGSRLKQWLFGGQSIPTKAALFDLGDYPHPIIADLFGEDSYFSDADAFWTLQRAAINALCQRYRDDGWLDVIVLEPGEYFQRWEHEKTSKAKGGKVYITLSHQGEVEVHEGWLSLREARKKATQEAGETALAPRPEMTASLRAYADLHRHAAVRAELTGHPAIAFRLLLTHAIAGSWLWNVRIEPQRAPTDAIAESVEQSAAEAAFDAKRREALVLLGCDADQPTVVGSGEGIAAVFLRLLALSDAECFVIAAIVMGETLAVGSDVVEATGVQLALDMRHYWQADGTFLDLLRNRAVLTEMVGEVAGDETAKSNAHEKAKTLRGILADCLTGSNGRAKAEGWVPRWLHFPATGYIEQP